MRVVVANEGMSRIRRATGQGALGSLGLALGSALINHQVVVALVFAGLALVLIFNWRKYATGEIIFQNDEVHLITGITKKTLKRREVRGVESAGNASYFFAKR